MNQAEISRRVADNLAQVRENINRTAPDGNIELICVTKYARDEWIRALIDAGAIQLAENILPRAAERFDALLQEGYHFTRHLIGAQQSRKVKLIPGHFDWLQACDRLKTARMLNSLLAERDESLNILVEVNISRESQKHGVQPEEVEEVCGVIVRELPQLKLRGLMAVPPWPDAYPNMVEFEKGTRGYFNRMKRMFDRIRELYHAVPQLDTLSLGMSLDYGWAIEEGATMVRVGSALFEGLEG